jgi:flavin reductase (DIM6/NTAB) family NADH-FMN oxidoreductase RutF
MSQTTEPQTEPPDAQDEAPPRAYRRALGAFATGVAVVSLRRADGGAAGITVNSFVSVSLEPPLVLWCLDLACMRYRAFAEAERWGVSVLGAADGALAERFTRAANQAIRPEESEDFAGVPVLKTGLAHFACRSQDRRPGGDHLIIVGAVEDFRVRGGDALTFYRGRYGGLPDPWK